MREADKPGFVAALAELSLLRPALKLTEAHYAAWWNAMRHDWTLAEFQRACAALAQECDDIVIGPQHFAALRRKAGEEAGIDAWTAVVRVNRAGGRGREDLSPRALRVVEAMGGWHALAMMQTTELPFRERRFRELWAELGEVDAAREALPSARSTVRITGPQPISRLLMSLTRDAS